MGGTTGSASLDTINIKNAKPDVPITITAIGGQCGAGIGGGYSNVEKGGISIDLGPGSSIEATGGEWAAGIGHGDDANVHNSGNGSGFPISIKLAEGASITAKGGDRGAGIGGGDHSEPGDITIEGIGTITATAGEYAAAIGGGDEGANQKINIRGEKPKDSEYGLRIYVTSTREGAGIGSGKDEGGAITIDRALISATVSSDAAGIGSGRFSGDNGHIDDITISNSSISVSSPVYPGSPQNRRAAGIGAGYGGKIHNITLHGVNYQGNNIGSSAYENMVLGITPNDVKTILIEDCDLTVDTKDNDHGPKDVNVGGWAGIGSGPWGSVDSITIRRSKIESTGSYSAGVGGGGAGIGTGGLGTNAFSGGVLYGGGKAGTILIEDSDVKAVGYKGGAGIGGGYGTTAHTITIKNSTVDAASDKTDNVSDQPDGEVFGAAIGGGGGASVDDILIEDSTVTAKARTSGAGIGSSGMSNIMTTTWDVHVKSITIKNSTVTAQGGRFAAGIGTGQGAWLDSGGSLKISDSKVTATGGEGGAGIGGGLEISDGRGGEGGNIYISGNCQIEAHGGDGAAGIGAGRKGEAKGIHLDLTTLANRSSYVKAYAGTGAAGIGAGSPMMSDRDVFHEWGPDASDITITGGYIYAQGGGERRGDDVNQTRLGSAAGIGGGARKGRLYGFRMSGGVVDAHAGGSDSYDIGCGGKGNFSDLGVGHENPGFTITGGTILSDRLSDENNSTITGGSIRANLGGHAVNAQGAHVYRTTSTLDKEPDTLLEYAHVGDDTYGTKDISTDSRRKIYLYLQETPGQPLQQQAWFMVKGDEVYRHYYGTTEQSGNGVMKMGGKPELHRTHRAPSCEPRLHHDSG